MGIMSNPKLKYNRHSLTIYEVYLVYLNFDNLKEYIKTIYKKYGYDFIINFKQWKN